VKGLEISAYNCHACPGMALSFGTSPIGAHHKDAWVIAWEISTDRFSYSKEKVQKVIELQRIREAFSNLRRFAGFRGSRSVLACNRTRSIWKLSREVRISGRTSTRSVTGSTTSCALTGSGRRGRGADRWIILPIVGSKSLIPRER